MRSDLLTLTTDDLISLSTRGTVNRATRDLAEGKLSGEVAEAPDGTLTATWSDGTLSTLPPNALLPDAQCTCPATGVCRHLIGAVLLYQSIQAAAPEVEVKPPAPWDPGAISDEALSAHYTKVALTRLRKQFEEPHVFELARGLKPLARIHTLSCSVRFMVPGDMRYAKCDCADPQPCSHIPLAIWAFRLLSPEAMGGLVETGSTVLPIPVPLLDDIETTLSDVLELGFAGLTAVSSRRLGQLAARCREEGLIWPAEILGEIEQEHKRYAAGDALFSAVHVAELLGELLIRSRAIRCPTGAVPALFVRGSARDVETKIGMARLTGLGCGIELRHNVTRIAAYLMDTESGRVLAVQRDTDPDSDKSYALLAQHSALKSTSLASLGESSARVKDGKVSAESVFTVKAAKSDVTPQNFAWENLRAPVLVEGFAEILALRSAAPPSCLRPRRVGEDLHVCPVLGIGGVSFDPLDQAVKALLIDPANEMALLVHPYTSRGHEGVDSLLWWLREHGSDLRFVSGHVRQTAAGLIIAPLALIFEIDGQRQMVQPWIARRAANMGGSLPPQPVSADNSHPLSDYPRQILRWLGELCLTGLLRVDEQPWARLAEQGSGLGLVRLVEPVAVLADVLAEHRHRLDWEWRRAARAVLDLAVTARFALDVF